MVEDENFDAKYEGVEALEETVEPELREPNICCRCSQDTEDDFELESCGHSICIDCRFKDNIQCIFCATTNDNKAKTNTETDICSSDILSYMKKKLINKDHIIDIQEDCASNAAKQMCTVCNRVFLKTNARYHYGCASGEKPLECTECGRKFVKKSHLEYHLNSRHFGIKPFKCTMKKCIASFTQKDKLVRHMKTHASEKHMCQVCDKTFSSLPILQFHVQKVHTTAKLFKCDMCPRTYKYKRTLTVHRLKHQGLKEHLCEICGKKYTVAAQLKQHKRSHVPISRRPYKCGRRLCKQRFITRHDKTRHELIHINTASPDFECSLCNTTFGRKDNLERHMKNFHQEEPWNSGKPVKIAAVVAPKINKTSLESNMAINLEKTNKTVTLSKYGKKKQCEIPETCKKEKKKRNVSKKHVQLKNKKKCNQQVCVHETVQPLPDVNSTEKLNQSELEQVSSVIVRPSVIKSAPKLQQFRALPSEGNVGNILDNTTGHSSTNTSLNNSVNNATYKHTYNTNKTPANNLNEGKPILEADTLNVSCRIICHTDALKRGNISKNDPANVRCIEDNMKSVINRHYEPSHNIIRRHEREEVLTTSTSSVSHTEESTPRLCGHSKSNLTDNYFNNPYKLPHFSCNPLVLNEYSRVHMNCEEKSEKDIKISYQYTNET